jgi:hypothetical protein
MVLSLDKPKLDNVSRQIWKSAKRLRGKSKHYVNTFHECRPTPLWLVTALLAFAIEIGVGIAAST